MKKIIIKVSVIGDIIGAGLALILGLDLVQTLGMVLTISAFSAFVALISWIAFNKD